MKHFLIRGALLCFGFTGLTAANAQTSVEILNIQKYWKLRSDFREQFIKIGPGPGEGVVARGRRPFDCVDNIGNDGTGHNQTLRGNQAYSSMHWGDGMIRHGYYLALLATEYKLLKDAGEDVNGVLNELYFALTAINRLDRNAEAILQFNYGMNFYDQKLNGFYLREDIPEDFAFQNWGNSIFDAHCDDSPMFKCNNAAKVDDGAGYWKDENSYQNTPSNDQLSSLLVGLSMIHSLVDDIYVRPPSQENGFYIVTETKNITSRLMTFLNEHNWMMIDVHGWPVNNGGGDAIMLSYPYYMAAKKITGIDYDADMDRRLASFDLNNIQFCLTGYGLDSTDPDDRSDACMEADLAGGMPPGEQAAFMHLENNNAGDAGENNNQDNSVFQSWQDGGDWEFEVNGLIKDVWESPLTGMTDLTDNGKMDQWDWPWTEIKVWDPDDPGSDITVFSNAAIASGIWTSMELENFCGQNVNYQAELINAIIRGEMPSRGRGFYRDILEAMPETGPYNVVTKVTDNPATFLHSSAANGWASQNLFTHPEHANGGSGAQDGIFNGLDYMLFHNLYYLAFKSQLPPYTIEEECCNVTVDPINMSPDASIPGGIVNFVEKQEFHNRKLALINTKTVSVLTPVNHNVTGTFDVMPYFAQYATDNIFPTKFQKHATTVQTGGTLNVYTRLQFCSGNPLTVKAGGTFDIKKAKTTMAKGSVVTNEGTIRLQPNTTYRLPVNGKLILKSGSMLYLSYGSTLILEGCELQYFDGATISMDQGSKIIFKGGTITSMAGGEFKIWHHAAEHGQLIFEGNVSFLSQQNVANGKVRLEGKGKDKTFLVLKPNARVSFGYAVPHTISQLVLAGGKIEMGTNAHFDLNTKSVISQADFSATTNNKGVTTKFDATFTNCNFKHVPVDAALNNTNGGILNMQSCYSEQIVDVPLTSPSMVKVTGRGLSMLNCTVKGVNQSAVKTRSLTLASTITSSTIQFGPDLILSYAPFVGVDDSSNVELTLKKCTIRYNSIGVSKNYGKLTLRCNTFVHNTDQNVKKINGQINANSTQGGGYNTFNPALNYITNTSRNLYFNNATVDLGYGYNYIGTANPSNQTVVVLTNTNVGLSHNQWNSANTAPSNVYTFTNTGSGLIGIVLSPHAAQQTCPTEGTSPGGSGGILGGKDEFSNAEKSGEESGIPMVYSSVLNDSIRLDHLYYEGTSYMSAYNDSLSDDVHALDYFKDMFEQGLNKSDSTTAYWLWLGLSDMKKALENAFMFNHLDMEDNAIAYDDKVAKYAKAMTYMTEPNITDQNFLQQFNHEMNKAQLMHTIGHTHKALNILQELESCGIDSMTQAQLNFWKSDYELAIAYQASESSPLDTTLTVNTSNYIDPEYVVNGYSFGADISALDHIKYPNCNFFKGLGEDELTVESFLIFPNPARESVTIVTDAKYANMDCQLRFEQIDGKAAILRDIKLLDKGKYSMNIDGFAPGNYVVTLIHEDGTKKVAKLVVQ